MEPRLQAETRHIDELVDQAMSGRVRIPDFQRGIRWREKDVRTLFDSIYRGFPIGTLLMWERPAEAANVQIGSVALQAPASDAAWWVIDGQQRLTSLVAVLRHPAPQTRDLFSVWFDLEDEQDPFFHPSPRRSTHLAIPLAKVLDPTAYQRWLFEFVKRTDRADLMDRANHLGAQIRRYRVPFYRVGTQDPKVARDIFIRTNRTGRRMEVHEVFAALATPGTASSMRPEEIAERLGRVFGEVHPNIVVKAAQALPGNNVTQGPTIGTDKHDRIPWMQDTERALHKTYQFLTNEVIHTRLLPARVTPVVALARFFHRFPEPSERSLRLLRRWLWRGFFSSSLESDARTLRRAVTAIDRNEDRSVQQLLDGVTPAFNALSERVDSRDGATRLAFLVMARQTPVYPGLDGCESQVFDWLQAHQQKVFVRWPGAPNTIWARFLTPGAKPSVFKKWLLELCADPAKHKAYLRSHLVSQKAALALALGDEAAFQRRRVETIEKAAKKLHNARAEPSQSDRLPLRLFDA